MKSLTLGLFRLAALVATAAVPVAGCSSQSAGSAALPAASLRAAQAIPALAHIRPDYTGVKIWVSMYPDYLLGTGKSGKTVKAAINTSQNGCYDPWAVKVDGSQNIWTACRSQSTSGPGVAQEYSSTGTSLAAYVSSCAASPSECSDWQSSSLDEGSNSNNVFLALQSYSYKLCNPSCTDATGTGFEYWAAGSPSSAPVLISIPTNNQCTLSPICSVSFMDLDGSGNIWFDFIGYNSTTKTFEGGLGEVTNPTTSPNVSVILPLGTYDEYAGGVYVSNGGTVLNVTDGYTTLTYQYHLPITPSSAPFNTLGPASPLGCCVWSGGFNSTDKNMVLANYSSGNWLNVGNVAKNSWKQRKAALFSNSLLGAAYTPSDK